MIYHGDCLEVLRTLPDCSVDAVVTDPPYGLSFMGKRWDYDVPSVEVWAECLRVLKPGGHLLAFAGTRTQHRMAVRIEDAGFEIRDMIAWVYSQGFPKSLDVSKAIDKAAGAEGGKGPVTGKSGSKRNSMAGDFAGGEYHEYLPATDAARQWQGWGTALKPSLEPVTVARKPLIGTVAENVLAHGTGGLNIDVCRIATDDKLGGGHSSTGQQMTGGWERPWMKDSNAVAANAERSRQAVAKAEELGRWPANLIHDGSDEVLAMFPDTGKGNGKGSYSYSGVEYNNKATSMFNGDRPQAPSNYNDKGSAARFFYCARQNVSMPEVGYNEAWQDQNQNQSSALTAGQNLSLLKAVGGIVQKAVATWQSLEGILSNAQSGAFTSVTQSELKTINEVVTATIASIGSGFLPAQQLEKPTQCGGHVKCAAMKEPTGITTITTSLCKSDGCVAVVTSTITQTNLERGVAASRFNYCAKASKRDRDEGLDGFEVIIHSSRLNKSGLWEQEEKLVRLLMVMDNLRPKVIDASGVLSKSVTEWNTLLFGSESTGQYQQSTTFTTKTESNSTTESKILSCFQNLLTSESMAGANFGMVFGGSLVESVEHGIQQITITSAKTESALGVEPVASKTRLRISVNAKRNNHVTVKPTDLMRYLCRLVTPPGGTVLDPFMGSGSTGKAAILEGFSFIGIEREAAYVEIAKARIAAVQAKPKQEDLF